MVTDSFSATYRVRSGMPSCSVASSYPRLWELTYDTLRPHQALGYLIPWAFSSATYLLDEYRVVQSTSVSVILVTLMCRLAAEQQI